MRWGSGGSARKVRTGGVGALILAAAGLVAGCGAAADIEEIKATQRQILERLAALEKNDRTLLANLRASELRVDPDPDTIQEITIGNSPVKGPEDAPVTMVEFADFQCPFSASAAALVDEILRAYPDEVRFVQKEFPLSLLHPDARNAARAALAAHRQGKFWEMQAVLFQHQHELDYESLERYAGSIGLDVDRFNRDMASADIDAELRADISEGRRARISGTPTFFVDGKRVTSRSFESFRVLIESALEDVRESERS